MFGNWFKSVKNTIQNVFYNTTYNLKKSKHDPAESPEIMRVVNKFASIFMDAEVSIQNDKEVINEAKTKQLNQLLASDPVHRGKSSFLSNLCKISLLQGGCILYNTEINNELKTFDLLEPKFITAKLAYSKNRLNILNFNELFNSFKYSDYYSGNLIDLVDKDVNIFVDNTNAYTSKTLSYCNNSLFLVSRLSEIQQKVDNSYYANNMLSSLLNRCSFMFLSRENKNEFASVTPIYETKERTKDFNEAYHISNSAVVPVGDNMRVLNTTISVNNTGVFESFEDTISAACNILGITRTIIEIQDSTFSNQQGAIKDAIQNGIQSFANKVAEMLTEMLINYNVIDISEHVVFDYTEVLKRNLANSSQDIEQTETEQTETEQTEITN